MHVVLAGGGSAGHVEPALSLADALRRLDPQVGITALGSAQGLEARLVPERGYDLAEIPRVPLPRKLSPDLLGVPLRLRAAVAQTRAHLDRVGADVVVGFGGYISVPAYLAARRRTPVVVHEANAKAGLANRLGARWAHTVAAAVPGTGLKNAQVIGIPLRQAIATLDRSAARAAARAALGLAADGPVLLVTGGSQGARRINEAVVAAAPQLAAAGVQVLHVAGPKQATDVRTAFAGQAPPTHHVLDYVDGMDQAYAAADLVLCRAGAMTCAELAAVGLPAVFVPLPIGNGEQALNAAPLVRAGGGLLVDDAAVDGRWLTEHLLPLLGDSARLAEMGAAASALGHRDADITLARLVLAAA